jgi:hypothetical protein
MLASLLSPSVILTSRSKLQCSTRSPAVAGRKAARERGGEDGSYPRLPEIEMITAQVVEFLQLPMQIDLRLVCRPVAAEVADHHSLDMP